MRKRLRVLGNDEEEKRSEDLWERLEDHLRPQRIDGIDKTVLVSFRISFPRYMQVQKLKERTYPRYEDRSQLLRTALYVGLEIMEQYYPPNEKGYTDEKITAMLRYLAELNTKRDIEEMEKRIKEAVEKAKGEEKEEMKERLRKMIEEME